MATRPPAYPRSTTTDRQTRHATRRRVIVCVVLSAVAHVLVLGTASPPIVDVAPEPPTATTLDVRLTDRNSRRPDVSETVASEPQAPPSLQEPDTRPKLSEPQPPAVTDASVPQPSSNPPKAETNAPDVVNRLQRYRWFDQPRLIDLPDGADLDDKPIRRAAGVALGSAGHVALPFAEPRFDLVDDHTGCDDIRENAQTDLERVPDATLPNHGNDGFELLSVFKLVGVIRCGVRSSTR